MDSLTLLADPTKAASGSRRTPLLKSDHDDVGLRATVMSSPTGLLLIRAWLGEETHYVYLVLDDRGFIATKVNGTTHESAYEHTRAGLAELGYELGDPGDDYSLLADHIEGQRRTSVLQDDNAAWAVRSKAMYDDEDSFLHVRVWNADLGYTHIVLHESGAFVASATGGNDSDAWDRLRGELRRRDIDTE